MRRAGQTIQQTLNRILKQHQLKVLPPLDTQLEQAGANGGRRFVQIGFDLLESDFPLHVGFPIFVANCLDWLSPSINAGAGQSIRTGQAAYIDVPPDVRELIVTDPSGEQHVVKVTDTPVVYEDTERAGVYQVRGVPPGRIPGGMRGILPGGMKEFACNVASPQESSTAPKTVLIVGKRSIASTGKGVRTNREFYGWLIFAALAVLAVEWYAYHRRL